MTSSPCPTALPWPAALAAAQAVAGAQDYPVATLYVVATPIGNLADLSLRALTVLQRVDALACEDTRHTHALLHACGLHVPPLLALHQHNEEQASAAVLARLAARQRVAYVSDAGTPAVSDPGARLVQCVLAAGYRVVPLPGASSVTTLISAAGAVSAQAEGWVFAGFLPSRTAQRQLAVHALAQEARAVVLLEAPHRITELAADLAVLGARSITVGRELTKQFEQIATMAAANLADWLGADSQRQRGEFALLLHPLPTPTDAAPDTRVLDLLLAELPLKTAVRLAAEITGQARNALYALALTRRPHPGEPAVARSDRSV